MVITTSSMLDWEMTVFIGNCFAFDVNYAYCACLYNMSGLLNYEEQNATFASTQER